MILLLSFVAAALFLIPLLILTSTPARAEDLVVTNPGDSGPGTLRDAIIRANENDVSDTITFAGSMRITPGSPLPTLVSPDPVYIDAGSHTVVIDGVSSGGSGIGANQQDNLTIKRLRIVNSEYGITLIACDRASIRSCLIGTSDGYNPEPNRWGVYLGGCIEARITSNTISGNIGAGIYVGGSSYVTIEANMIGLSSSGYEPLPNGIAIQSVNNRELTIGTTVLGAGNLISSRDWPAVVDLQSEGITLIGNIMGADVAGNDPIGKGGLLCQLSKDVFIGDGSFGGRNQVCGGYCYAYGSENVYIWGNYLGVNRLGSEKLGVDAGVAISDCTGEVQIGGPSPGEGNVTPMVIINETDGAVISGNHIGVEASGTARIGGTNPGVSIVYSAFCLVGGDTPQEANVISGSDNNGIHVGGGENNTIAGNLIGTSASGNSAIPNKGFGVVLGTSCRNNVVGGDSPSARNVISGNGTGGADCGGILLNSDGVANNVVMGNYIGVGSGGSPLPNQGYGVYIARGSGNTIGGPNYWGDNTIAYNTRSGIWVAADTGEAPENRILANRVHSNEGLGIDLWPRGPNVPQENFPYPTAGMPNLWMHFPLISGAVQTPAETIVEGTSDPYSTIRLYLADSGEGAYGEGRDFLNATTADGAGNFRFSALSAPAGSWLTATAMDTAGNTSEFCLNAVVRDMAPPTGSISIENGAPQTTERDVKLYPSVSDNSSPPERIQMLISEDPGFSGASWEPFASEKVWTLSEGLGEKTVYAMYLDEVGNSSSPCSASIELVEAIPPPAMSPVWYFAEGCTREPFEEWIMIYNPNEVDAHIEMTVVSPQGNSSCTTIVDARYRQNFFLDYEKEYDDKDVSVVLHARDPWGRDLGVVCERSMYRRKAPDDPGPRRDFTKYQKPRGMQWHEKIDGHCSIGATDTGKTWYFAEGCTGYGFETWFLLLNPTDAEARVNMSFFTDEAGRVDASLNLPPMSRVSLRASDYVPDANFSTIVESDPGIVAERSMYLETGRGGTCTTGVQSPSETWYMAEGSTAWGFDEYLLVFNPTDEKAALEIGLLGQQGPGPTGGIEVDSRSRKTVHVNEIFPNSDCALTLKSRNGVRVVCERAMYWDGGGHRSGNCSEAAPEPKRDWYLSEGENLDRTDLAGYLLIANPTDEEVSVRIVVNLPEGEKDWTTVPRIKPRSRVTIPLMQFARDHQMCLQVHVMDEDPEKKIVVERSMYWCDKYGGHEGIGYAP